MKASQRVAKNAACGVLSGVVGGGLQFLSVIIVARGLGVSEFGTFNYLLAFGILFQFLADFGLANILVREITRRPDELEHLLGSAKGLMWLLFFISVPLLGVAILVQNIPSVVKAQCFLMGVASLTSLQGVSYAAVLRAFEDMEFNAIGFTLHKVALLFFTIVSLKVGFGLWGLVFSNLGANLLLWFYYSQVVGWRFGLRVSLRRDVALWKSMIGEALPLGGGLLLRQIGWQLDSLLLFWLVDPYSVGLFGGPYRLLLGIRVLSMILIFPLYPGLVRLAKDSPEQFWVYYQRAIKLLICLSLPGTVAFLITPKIVIKMWFGLKFLSSATALQCLGFAFVPMFVSALFPYVYTALGKQRIFLLTIGATVILRVSLELWLIPRFGYMSACVILATCEILAFAMFIILLGWGRFSLSAADVIFKPFFAGAIMGAVLYLSRRYIGQGSFGTILLMYFLGGTAYIVALFCTRPFSKVELSLAKEGLGFIGPYLRSWSQKPEIQP